LSRPPPTCRPLSLLNGSFKDMGDGSYQMTYSVEEAGEYCPIPAPTSLLAYLVGMLAQPTPGETATDSLGLAQWGAQVP
jgi:hypothetical protein